MRRHQEGLLVAAEYKRMERTIRGQEYVEVDCWRGQGQLRAVTPFNKKKKKKED
jgi:hypothetical protein